MNEYIKYNKNNEYELMNENDGLVLELWDVDEIRNDVRFYKGFSNEKYDSKKCITDIEIQIVKRLKEVCEKNEILEKCVPKIKRNENDCVDDNDSKRKVRRFLKRRTQPISGTKNKTNMNNDKINLFLGDEKNCNTITNTTSATNGKPMLKQSTTSPNLFTNLKRKEMKQDSIIKYHHHHHQHKVDIATINKHNKTPLMLKDLVIKDNNNNNHKISKTITSTATNSNNITLNDTQKHSDINIKNNSNTQHIHKPTYFHKGSLLLLTRNHSFLNNNDIIQTSINKRNNSINISSYKTQNINSNNNTLFNSYNSNNKLRLNIHNSSNKITKDLSSYASSSSSKTELTNEIQTTNTNKQYTNNNIKKQKLKRIPIPLPKHLNTKINKTLHKSLLLHKKILSKSNSYSYYTSHKVFIDNYNYKLQARSKINSMDNINILLPLEKIPKKYFIYKHGHFVSTNPKYQDFLYNCNFISKVTPTNSFKFKKAIGEQVLKMRVKKRRFGSVRFYKYETTNDYDKGYNKYKSIKQGKNRKKELFDEIIRKTELNGNKLKKLSFN